MNKVEIETITEAMLLKQTWIRKELDDFLEVWADITDEEISGHGKFVLYEFSTNDDAYVTDRLCLVRGKSEVDGDSYDGYSWTNWDNYLKLEDQSIERIRKIIEHIHLGFTKYFKNIQADIGLLDETGRKIRDIVEKLN